MNIVGIIQARVSSKRLPAKMMLLLYNKPIIEWVVRRVCKSKLLNQVVVALPDSKENDIIEYFLKSLDIDIEIFRGSENDVLKRYYDVANKYNADIIVRICADNPFICPEVIDYIVNFFKQNQPCDYVYCDTNFYPDGIGGEVISYQVLKKLIDLDKDIYRREHCCKYILDNPESFIIKIPPPPSKIGFLQIKKLDIDTFTDYVALWRYGINIEDSCEEIIKKVLKTMKEC